MPSTATLTPTARSSETTDDVMAPTTEEKKEYARFLEEEAKRAAAEEAARLEEAKVELERTEHEKAYQSALAVISEAIERANQYNNLMSQLAAQHLAELDLSSTPKLLSGGTLRDYQLDGFRWLVHKYLLGESGIIADEMGLGKTIQVLSFIAWMVEQKSYHPILIICPLTVVGNWISEFKTFAPKIPTIRYTGDRANREMLQSNKANFPPECFVENKLKHPMPVVVTSYQTAMNDADFLSRVKWRVLVLDEGHRIKNEACAFRRILNTYCPPLRSGSQLTKVLLTGTPVQNDLTELWSLCNFVMPQVFRSKEEFMRIYRFIERGAEVNQEYYKKAESRRGIVTKLHSLLSRYILRRTKDEVKLTLPPKAEVLVYTPLTAEQVALLKGLQKDSITAAVRKLGWVSATRRDDLHADQAIVSSNNKQMQMRKICVHPFWIAEPREDSLKDVTDSKIITASGKLAVLDKMLTYLRAGGHKVLIFSQFKTVLDILQDYLLWRNSAEGVEWAVKTYGKHFFEHIPDKTTLHGGSAPPQVPRILTKDVHFGEYRVLHGSVAAEERDKAIDEFNHDPDNKIFAFLLSTKAGGQGINLTAADTVIFYDSDWNPTSDAQAMDRAHRIGQTRPVVVYRLVTEGASVERRIVKTASSKESLSRMVLQEGVYKFSTSSSPKVSTPTNATSPEAVGRISDALLHYWLREDITERELQHGGIQDAELAVILDRPRALQAGKRVTDDVEKDLVAQLSDKHITDDDKIKEEGTTDTAAHVVAAADESKHASARKTNSTKKRQQAASTPSPATTTTPATPRSGDKRRRETPASVLSVPPSCNASSDVLIAAAAEQTCWTSVAAAAPYTASKGGAYEFVYHTTTGSLLPSTSPDNKEVVSSSSSISSKHIISANSPKSSSPAVITATPTTSLSSSMLFDGGVAVTPAKRKRMSAM